MRVILCIWAKCRKNRFYNEMASDSEVQNPIEMVLGLGDF